MQTKFEGKKQEPWRPQNYFHFMQKYQFTPSFIVDISDVFEVRMNSVRAHKSQFYDPASNERETILSKKEFLEYIEVRARFFGEMIGVRYGEPFFSVQPVGAEDIFGLKFFRA